MSVQERLWTGRYSRFGTGINRDQDFKEIIGKKARRRLAAQRGGNKDAVFWLGMFGLIGWSVAIPTLVGTAVGVWLDGLFPGRVSWTLTLMLVGVVCGCLIAWRWIRQEGDYG